MAVDAVIFDLDNTLVNRKLAFHAFTERLVDRYLVVSDPSERARLFEYIREADRNGYRGKRELYQELLETLTWKKETTIEELLDHSFSEFYKCTVVMDGALDVIHYLKSKGIKLGIVTNGSIHSQNAKIDQVGLRAYFDAIVVSDEIQIKKPDKRIFEIALQRLGVRAEKSYYIGDHPVNDIKGAFDAGLIAVWLKGFLEWDVHLGEPQYAINDLKELIDIIEACL